MTERPLYDYPVLIADWMTRPDAQEDDGITPAARIGLMRGAVASGFDDDDLDATRIARELALFDKAAADWLKAMPAPATAFDHDFELSFREWAEKPENRSGRMADPSRRMGAANTAVATGRSGLETELRGSGLSGAAMAEVLARFDAAAERFLEQERTAWSKALKGRKEPLGLGGWIGALWISGSVAVGAFSLLSALLLPLWQAGRLDRDATFVPAGVVGAIVFVAAVLWAGRLIRDYREVGFILFWWPVIVGAAAVNVGPAELARIAIDSMGPDFLPLALPLALFTGAGLVLAGAWAIWRHRRAHIPSLSAKPDIHPLMLLLVAGFSVMFFTIGAIQILEWGAGPALVVGLLVTGLLARQFPEKEIGFGFVLIVALPLALLATEMPPGNLSALTILVLALAVALAASVATVLRGRRRSTFMSGLTAAALALMLVIAPTGPSPAMRMAEWTGNLGRPLADRVMASYAALYRTDYGQPVLALIGGFRSGIAQVRVARLNETRDRIEVTVDIRNDGERGIASIRVDLIGDADAGGGGGLDACRHPVVDRSFDPPIWPGDRARTTLYWAVPADCAPGELARVGKRVRSAIEAPGSQKLIPGRVLETRSADPAGLFRKDARAWLGL